MLLRFKRSDNSTISELQERVRQLEKRNAWLEQHASAHAQHGLSEDEHGIFGRIQLAHLPFQANFEHLSRVPTRFWMEVGANSGKLLAEQMLAPGGAFDQNVFLLSFEPLLDKYAALLTRFGGGVPGRLRNLGMHHEKALVFPLAVGCEGAVKFNVAPLDGCSSMLQPREGHAVAKDPLSNRWAPWMWEICAKAKEERLVPCVSLEHVIGSWLQGSNIEYLKVDAQGADLTVIQSAGSYIDRLQAVTLEIHGDFVARVYEGAPNCTYVFMTMLQLGFLTKANRRICKICQEIDVTFFRPGARLPPHLKTSNLEDGQLWRASPSGWSEKA